MPTVPEVQPSALVLQRFQALAEATRLQIVCELAQGELCVCELQETLVARQSRLSFHLRKLREAGIVRDRREGRWSFYSLAPDALEELRTFLSWLGDAEGWAQPSPRSSLCCD